VSEKPLSPKQKRAAQLRAQLQTLLTARERAVIAMELHDVEEELRREKATQN
jgi:hypothetical protein